MSRSINHVTLVGRMGNDPVMRQTSNGTSVASFRLATDRYRPGRDPVTDWHNVVCWGKTAEAVTQYMHKGDEVSLVGRLSTNVYEDRDGNRRERSEVHVNEISFHNRQVVVPQNEEAFLDENGYHEEMSEDDDPG